MLSSNVDNALLLSAQLKQIDRSHTVIILDRLSQLNSKICDSSHLLFIDADMLHTDLSDFKVIRTYAAHLPIIVLITQEQVEIAMDLQLAGAQNYLLKNTYSPNILQKAVTIATSRLTDAKGNDDYTGTLGNITTRNVQALDSTLEANAVMEAIKDCFLMVNKHWIVTYWNTEAEKVLGKKRSEIVGKNLWKKIEVIPSKFFDMYNQALTEQTPVHFIDYFQPFQKWFEISAYPLRNGLAIYFKDITENRNHELELLQTKNQKEALINSTNDLIWAVDRDLRLTAGNESFRLLVSKFTGRQIQEGELLLEDDGRTNLADIFRQYYNRALEGELFSVELSTLLPGTRTFVSFELAFHPIKDPYLSSITGAACYARDVSERKAAEKMLSRQNKLLKVKTTQLQKITNQLRKVMNSSLDVICTIDLQGKFVQVSDACYRVWGYKPEEMIGRPYITFVEENDKEATIAVGQQLAQGEDIISFENCYKHKDGHSVPIIWSAHQDQEDELVYCVGKDASELKKTLQEKEQKEHVLSSLVKNGADMVGIIDLDTQYKFVSPNVTSLLGYQPDFFYGKTALSLIHEDDIAKVLPSLEKITNTRELRVEHFRFKDVNGNYKWIETILTNQLDNPYIKGIVFNSRDITHIKEREFERELIIRELTKINNDLKQFTFITSHNLRAPLSNLMGILQIVDYDSLTEYNRQLLQMINTSTANLSQTIHHLVQILIIKNNVNIEKEPVVIKEVFERVSSLFISETNDLTAKVETDFKASIIHTNKAYLESIFVNLLSNSIKYRSPNRLLKIKVDSELKSNGDLVIQFTDNGLGIDLSRYKDRIFGLYQRFHENTEGQGIGLFIIKAQVNAMGGTIDLKSTIDKGTTFTITFNQAMANSRPLKQLNAGL